MRLVLVVSSSFSLTLADLADHGARIEVLRLGGGRAESRQRDDERRQDGRDGSAVRGTGVARDSCRTSLYFLRDLAAAVRRLRYVGS